MAKTSKFLLLLFLSVVICSDLALAQEAFVRLVLFYSFGVGWFVFLIFLIFVLKRLKREAKKDLISPERILMIGSSILLLITCFLLLTGIFPFGKSSLLDSFHNFYDFLFLDVYASGPFATFLASTFLSFVFALFLFIVSVYALYSKIPIRKWIVIVALVVWVLLPFVFNFAIRIDGMNPNIGKYVGHRGAILQSRIDYVNAQSANVQSCPLDGDQRWRCLSNFAVAHSDASICWMLPTTVSKQGWWGECIYNVAVKTFNVSLCKQLSNGSGSLVDDQSRCLINIAAALKDLKICDDVSNDSGKRSRCIEDVAIVSGQKDLCNNIAERPNGSTNISFSYVGTYRDNCLEKVSQFLQLAMANSTNNLELCKNLTELAPDCISQIAFNKKDEGICLMHNIKYGISSEYLHRWDCIIAVAVAKNDLGICQAKGIFEGRYSRICSAYATVEIAKIMHEDSVCNEVESYNVRAVTKARCLSVL